ncbi:Aste57867_23932 [Aphanomyces stellatus]|uniref:Aste57867_23932 protein n=1 Tax=Aphanomyces stellatus TaxID=120398 RepID=A0A485LQN1_9STRA|nr:hypothetical protein As57867_023859 [Aphanomyces stellatus]VFU00575.1 Aste57867_23932 [Aphanomyces stellatus]
MKVELKKKSDALLDKINLSDSTPTSITLEESLIQLYLKLDFGISNQYLDEAKIQQEMVADDDEIYVSLDHRPPARSQRQSSAATNKMSTTMTLISEVKKRKSAHPDAEKKSTNGNLESFLRHKHKKQVK